MNGRAPGPIAGRVVALLVGDNTPAKVVGNWRNVADDHGVEIVVVGPHLGTLAKGSIADRTVHTAEAVEFDAVVLASEPDEGLALFAQEAYRHHKTLAILETEYAGLLQIDPGSVGVASTTDSFFAAVGEHRDWAR